MRKYLMATFASIALVFPNLAQAGYDPNIGVWLSRDPIGEAGGTNLYGYVGNNPVNGIDPFGLKVQIGYDRAPGFAGKLTPFHHLKLVITPDVKGDFPGYPSSFVAEGGRTPRWELGPSMREAGCDEGQLFDINPDAGESDSDFIKRILNSMNNADGKRLPYTTFPKLDGIDNGYNSNSFISGLLNSVGKQVPFEKPLIQNTPGSNKPVPGSFFK